MRIHDPNITGSAIAQSGFTGSLQGTASWATQATTAATASYITSSFFTGANAVVSASYALTASYVAASSVTETYSILSNMGGTTLAANTTYYIGQGGYSAATGSNVRNAYIPFTGRLVAATITTGTTSATVTNSDVAVNFRLNNTADTSLGNVRFTGGNANASGRALSYNITGLDTAVTAGDFFEIKLTTPASYPAPPAAASLTVMLYFTRTS